MNRRKSIAMTPDELAAYLAEARNMALCTIGKDGYPHVVAMSYMAKGGLIYMTSFRKAQKVLNAKRNPRVAVMVESGRAYAELKGVLIRGDCEVIEQDDAVWAVMKEVRDFQGTTVSPTEDAVLKERARKRAVLKITPVKTSSWDHTKLPTGVY